MAVSRVLEWDKEGDGIRTVRASRELPAGVELTGTPSVRVDKRHSREGAEPEDWRREESITVSDVTIVDALADDGTTLIAANQAVQFQLDADTDTLPDKADNPIPGNNYRVVVICGRDDAGDWVGKVPLRIHP
jgi:hypothetical protein